MVRSRPPQRPVSRHAVDDDRQRENHRGDTVRCQRTRPPRPQRPPSDRHRQRRKKGVGGGGGGGGRHRCSPACRSHVPRPPMPVALLCSRLSHARAYTHTVAGLIRQAAGRGPPCLPLQAMQHPQNSRKLLVTTPPRTSAHAACRKGTAGRKPAARSGRSR